MLLYHRRDKDPIISYSFSKKDVESMANSYVATQSEIKDSPKELMEKIKTVDSGGAYNETNFGISIKSVPKKNCIVPATYNQDTFSCDCPLGSDYIEMYGCKSKCPHWKKYNTDGTCTDYCDYSTHPHQYWNGSSCTDCPVGTKNDGNNHCIPLNPCPNGTDYTEDSPYTCVSTNSCLPYEMSVDGRCYTKCPLEHEIYDTHSGSCVSCYKPGTNYTVSQINDGSNNCIAGTYTCKKGEHIDPTTGVCVSQCLDYQKFVGFETIAGSCGSSKAICVAKCDDNQYYDSYLADCRYCPVGQTTDGKNGCVPIQVTPVPTPHCTAGFQLNSDYTRCESKCDYWRYNDDVDPTYCDLLCPAATQFYDLTRGTDAQGNKINNGCADCPVGWATDNSNQCTICDSAGGYIMQGGKCIPECPYWKPWDKENNICKYNCPDHRQYYIDGKGCAYCPVGYLTVPDLSNNCKSTQDNCDNEKGYFAAGKDKDGNTKCVFQCSPWQYWDNTLQTPGCVNHCTVAPNFYYDTSHDLCVKCEDLYPTIPSSQITFDAANNKCIVNKPTPAPTFAPTSAPISVPTSTPSSKSCWIDPIDGQDALNDGTCGPGYIIAYKNRTKCCSKINYRTDNNTCCGESIAPDTGCWQDSKPVGFTPPGYKASNRNNKKICPETNYNSADDTCCGKPVPGSSQYTAHPNCYIQGQWIPYNPPVFKGMNYVPRTLNEAKTDCDQSSECTGFEIVDIGGGTTNVRWFNTNNNNIVQTICENHSTNATIYTKDGTPPVSLSIPSPPPPPPPAAPTCKYLDRSSYSDDYVNTCNNINDDRNGNISALCRRANGSTAAATINYCDCNGRIQNYDGNLVCNPRSDYQGDDYRNSCTNVTISSGVISATCDAYGTPNQTSIDGNKCMGKIQNNGGRLVCH